MRRITKLAVPLVAAIAGSIAATPCAAQSTTVLYEFAALRGPVATCQWFDDNINDRSLGAIIQQTDELYNRTPLVPGAPVSNVQTAQVSNGTQVAGFLESGTQLCSGDDAINPTAPEAAPPPPPSD